MDPIVVDPAVLDVINQVLAAAGAGKWLLFVVLLLSLGFRLFKALVVPRLPDGKFKAFLASTWGGWLVNFTGSVLAALVTAAVAGAPLTVGAVISLLLGALTVSLAGAGSTELLKDAAKSVGAKAKAGDELSK